MSNKRILKNSALLYLRLLVVIALGLFTTRIVINALGIDDYGIYGVVAGIVTMLGFMNAAMSSSTQRYLSVDIGLKDICRLQKTFSTAVNIHIFIGIASVMLAEVVGVWAINYFLEIPENRLRAANIVFQFSLIPFFLGIIQVPFHAATIAYERMNAYAYISIADSILKLAAAYFLYSQPFDRLIVYSQFLAVISMISLSAYFVYVKLNFNELRYIKYFEKKYYVEILSFSGWNLFGNIAAVARNQGLNILLNIFFGVTLNAAYAVSHMVQGVLVQFAASIQQALNPQITKCYAAGDYRRTERLMHLSSKFSFFAMLVLIFPVLLNLDFLLGFWLGKVPEYSTVFLKYLFVYVLIEVLSNSLMIGLQATGKISNYQMVVGFLVMLNFPLAYLGLKYSLNPEVAFQTLILISIVSLIARLIFVKKQLGYPIVNFVNEVLFFALFVSISAWPLLFINDFYEMDGYLKVVRDVCVCVVYLGFAVFTLGLKQDERQFVRNFIKQRLM